MRGAAEERVVPRIPLWEKNGSINLELVKSLFISENEKDVGRRWGGGETRQGKGRRERGKGRGEARRIYTSKATAGILRSETEVTDGKR